MSAKEETIEDVIAERDAALHQIEGLQRSLFASRMLTARLHTALNKLCAGVGHEPEDARFKDAREALNHNEPEHLELMSAVRRMALHVRSKAGDDPQAVSDAKRVLDLVGEQE